MKRLVRAEEHAQAKPPYFLITWAEDTREVVEEPLIGGGSRKVMVPAVYETQETRAYHSAPEREAILALVRAR